jgi:UDP-glucose 4-epimerase
VVNVAGDGVILLSHAIRLAGRIPTPVPPSLTGPLNQVLRRTGLVDFSREQLRFLSYGRGLDTARMRSDLGFEPRWSTRAAFEDFVRGRRLRGALTGQVAGHAERAVLGLAGFAGRQWSSFAGSGR